MTSHVLSILSRSFAPVTHLSNRGNLVFLSTRISTREKSGTKIELWFELYRNSDLYLPSRTPSWWKRMCWIYVAVRTVFHVSVVAGLTALTSSRVHFVKSLSPSQHKSDCNFLCLPHRSYSGATHQESHGPYSSMLHLLHDQKFETAGAASFLRL